MACGNTVAFPALATPCRASFHHSYAGMPSLSTAGEVFVSCDIFSSRVILVRRSLILVSTGMPGSWKVNSYAFCSLTSLFSVHEKNITGIMDKINNLK
jgi:hypothetical protein